MAPYKTFLIAGPTASGKSGLALKLAQHHRGVIINTDSMQVYRDLRILTARPTLEDETAAPHRLYGTIDAAETFSTGAWLRAVGGLLPELSNEFETIIFVGGTGLYFNALTMGLSEVPETPLELRHNLRTELESKGAEALYRQLEHIDQRMAALLAPTDGQRIVRALEVFQHTGHSLRYWQENKSEPLVDLASNQTKAFVLLPDATDLAKKIEVRFDQMVKTGAVDEVAALMQRNLDLQLPAMKAIGVSEIGSFLAGQSTLETATNKAVIASRQYAKRQRTWFRGQMDAKWMRFQNVADIFKAL